MSHIIMKKRIKLIKPQENLIDRQQLIQGLVFILRENYIAISYIVDEKIKLEFLNGQTFTIVINEN